MSTYALGTAVSGLSVAQSQINTISRNISNASIEGYSRKGLEQFTGPTGAPFTGRVTRAIDEALALAIRESNGELNKLDVRVQLLQQIEAQFGRPEDNSSLPGVIKKLESAFRDIQTSPEKTTLYSTLVGVADEVARTFNRLYERAEDVRTDTLNRIDKAISDVNAILKQVHELNSAISAGGVGLDTTDLEDQRDQALNKLAGLMDFTSYKQANGEIAIYSKQGMVLLDSMPRTITAAGIGTKPSVAPAPPIVVIRSGELGGLLEVRDKDLPQIAGQLDDMARALTTAFSDPPPPAAPPNGVGLELFNDGGGSSYDPLSGAGYARRIAVNETIRTTPTLIRDGASATPLPPSDTTYIDMAVAIFSRNDVGFTANGLPASGNILQVTTDFIAAQSSARENAAAGQEYQKALKESFEVKHSAKTGVNLDQEMAQLIIFQQVYGANARMIQTAKDLVDELMSVR